ncbi:ABC transporter ATP-binding protein [Phenylobacterium sp.]|uniref:ABC transporter ATP-binding protein n=1 Tax=Phenylobacterium sp. TaxID=1871053 RepID=UPI00272F9E49|nr:ABC transporter ATP-binding protein [Phenylobacterium sp.]MDP1874196.1 ABC transporter ATP-binding protein [Phenylobacterium sp.]MDP3300276.1 ABC transporter ATP-binding protein [Phenylobacterium sp.]
MTPVLSFRNVWVEYGDHVVLEKVSLDVAPGAFVSIVGPSGAGKSTFLRLALGQEAPSRGEILLDGAPIPAEPGPDRGVVFQRYSVFPHMTVLQNVMFGARCDQAPLTGLLIGSARRKAKAEAMAILDQVGLAASVKVFPRALSGGMQQRLAIAQALITRPRILLLDEPFGALDPGVRLDMHELITGLWREHGLTILMVTHDIKEAFKLGTRVIAVDKRRHDPHAPHRYGSTAVYDFPLDDKMKTAIPKEIAALTGATEA